MPQIVEDYTPITQGDTYRPFSPIIQQKDESGKWVPFNLDGLTISMKMVSEEIPTLVKVCGGQWTIDNASQGECHYEWEDDDVDTPGLWKLSMKFTNAAGKFVHGETKWLQIDEAL